MFANPTDNTFGDVSSVTPSVEMCRLLAPGVTTGLYRICRIDNQETHALRLLEMGLVPGVTVELICALPWGGPVLLRRGRMKFALRREEANSIWIQK